MLQFEKLRDDESIICTKNKVTLFTLIFDAIAYLCT